MAVQRVSIDDADVVDSKRSELHIERKDESFPLEDPDAGKSDEEKLRLDRKLMRKVDLWLIPWLCLLYLLSFLDRTNIGNARLAGMEEDLNMTGHDFNNTLTIFFISYALAEPVTNILLKRLTPRVFFTGIILLWGLFMTLMSIVKNYASLMALRFLLGLAEAGLFPGVNFYLGSWYKRNELGLRAALFLSAAALAGSFGGLLAAALSTLNGVSGLPGWAWIFLIEGIVTVCVGFFCWWMVFDWPDTAGFLTPDERLRLCWRLTNDKQASTAEDYGKRHIYAALRDWKTWLFSIMFIGCCLPLYSFSLFLPTILRGMGYTGTHAQLLSVPPYASAAAATVLVGWLADRTRPFGAVGFAMLIASADPHIQYAGTFLGAIGIYPAIPNTLAWVSNNTEGVYKRGVVIGIVVGTGNLSGIVSSNIFLLSDSPRFHIGKGVVLATMLCFLQFGSIAMHVLLRRENQKRLEGQRDSMHEAMTSDEIWAAGDKRPDFIYTL